MAARNAHASLAPSTGDVVGDLADQAAAQTEVKLAIRLREGDDHLLRAIAEALARIDKGRYGICELCQRAIPQARLNLVPWTRFCRDCKEDLRA